MVVFLGLGRKFLVQILDFFDGFCREFRIYIHL
ncbi:MAG: SelB C-terminal domain-containing protein [Lachnospiraceae bacterium]|nr:SelB C-terminal domain-containing protein [Lachnospiraceae bacterium]